MYQLETTASFRSAYKKILSNSRFKEKVFNEVIQKLLTGEMLEAKYKNHMLKGNMLGLYECHLAPDILLVYSIDDYTITLTLVKIGSHSTLFNK